MAMPRNTRKIISFVDGIVKQTKSVVPTILLTQKMSDLTNLGIVDLSEEEHNFVFTLTTECNNLLQRVANCPPSLISLRKLIMNYEEFLDGHQFDPFIHNDYDFIQTMISHFTRLAESPANPLLKKSRERTAATFTTFPIVNNLFLQYQDLVELKWVEVLHEDTDLSKIDGLILKKSDKKMMTMLELAGGINTSTKKKLLSDVYKSYKNALKCLKRSKQKKMFIVLYYDNTLYFESLTNHEGCYVRKRHLNLPMPTNAREIKSFAAKLPSLLSWRQAIIKLAESSH